jgi:hypothetical protein
LPVLLALSSATAELTYLLTYGAEPFMRSRQLCSPSRTSQQQQYVIQITKEDHFGTSTLITGDTVIQILPIACSYIGLPHTLTGWRTFAGFILGNHFLINPLTLFPENDPDLTALDKLVFHILSHVCDQTRGLD